MMNKICPGPETIRGIDLSPYQFGIDWKAVAGSDIQFASIKASEGDGYKSPTFSDQWEGSRAAGLVRGAYHFFRPNVDPMRQAQNFLQMVNYKSLPDDLPPTLDWEVHGGTGPLKEIENALIWMREIERVLKKKPILYIGPYFFVELGSPKQFIDYPLWIANYQVKCPFVPLPFTSWKFWQYSDNGHVPGIKMPVDLDMFNGNLDQLKKFAKS